MIGGGSDATTTESQTINNDSQYLSHRNPNEDYDLKKKTFITPVPKITKRDKNKRRESNYVTFNDEEALTLYDIDINPTLILTANTPEQFLIDIIENSEE